MEIKDINELMNRFENSRITYLDLEYQGVHLRMKKEKEGIEYVPGQGSDGGAKTLPVSNPAAEDTCKAQKQLKAPLVGVFYKAPAAGEKPFVAVGQKFSKGDILGIIEAMKCMNEIIAQEDGVVDELLVDDETLVEYNQPLLAYH